MRKLKLAGAYKRDLQLTEARDKDLELLREPLSMLLNEQPLPPKYKDHPLRGAWKGHRDFHVQGDWIVIYRLEDDSLVLVRTGTHSDIFN